MNNDFKYEVAVIVATYNQPLEKILFTINSIILQKDILLKIIIADDYSKENHFVSIDNYLKSHNFNNYILLESECNNGTVNNYFRCMDLCESEYVKFFSPGDAFYNEKALHDWISWMREMKADVSICNAIYYSYKGNNIFECLSVHTYPQNISVFKNCENKNKQLYYQLLCNDYWLGAATVIKTSIAKSYLKEIKTKVKYLEDSIYRLMAYDKINRCHYPIDAIFYECDTGISSLGESGNKWHKILMDEWYQTSLLILDKMKQNNDSLYKKFNAVVIWKKNSNLRGSDIKDKPIIRLIKELIPLYFKFPGLFFWHLRTRLKERKSHYYSNEVIQPVLQNYYKTR